MRTISSENIGDVIVENIPVTAVPEAGLRVVAQAPTSRDRRTLNRDRHQEKPDRVFLGLCTMCLSRDDQVRTTSSTDIFDDCNNKNT
jgi:hypothetical protein